MTNILIGILSIFCLTIGQTFLKLAIDKSGGIYFRSIITDLFRLALNFYFISGASMYLISGILWLYILSKMEFSVVFPLVSLSYVFALFIGYYIFNENISINKCFGVLFILLGVFFIVKNKIY